MELLCRTGPVRQAVEGLALAGFKSTYLPAPVHGRNAVTSLLKTAGKLLEFGYPVSLQETLGGDAGKLEKDGKRRAAELLDDLPPYPWDHPTNYLYESNLGIDNLPWLRDHLDDCAIYPILMQPIFAWP